MIPTQRRGRRRTLLSWFAAVFVAVWIGGVAVLIASTGDRGADDPASLVERATAVLRAGDGDGLHELLLDAPESSFSEDYAARVRAAGTAELTSSGPDGVEIRSGAVHTTLSVTEEGGRWYLSLLPPGSPAD
ncbi:MULTISPECIES: hypothetical protein [unclassified Pseudonocardia]|uniref:hypothetical protein n=1 Tax=unclassified Pseudonocardia TaxID=2619320 RepID=UPI0001FFE905|nr:hypothetical protein [Pseudonocardia sp. Ae707_Ps1]OLM19238.1 hypothetical protein Ae707Ps1_3497c [Pseudonocardia sp. Ae707_Ps1]